MQLLVVALTCFAAFGGFMFGYDIGIINGVKDMDGFRRAMDLSLTEKTEQQFEGSGSGSGYNNTSNISTSLSCAGTDANENALLGLVVSLFSVGCFFGALLSGVLSDPIGRKYAVIVGGVVFFIGGAVQAASFYLGMILVGRMVAGVGVGVLSMIVPVYNAELAPKALRGRLVSLNQLLITAGIMVSFCVNVALHTIDYGWRIALGLQCVLAIILIGGMLLLPETPRWLVKKGRHKQAEKVLKRLRKDYSEEEIKKELTDIQFMTDNSKETLSSLFRAVLRWRIAERIILGVVLQLLQQLIGMNVIMYYSTSIFCSIQVSSYVATAIVGIANFLVTFVGILLVDKVGRKSLLLIGALGMCVCIFLGGLLINIYNVDSDDIEEGGHMIVGYIVAVLIVLFVSFFAFSWGPIVWVVTSEIFPLSVRGVAVSITTSGNWIGNFIVAMMTPLLLGSFLKTSGTFFILAIFLISAFLFVLLTLPETKGVSLEKIDMLFTKPWIHRIDLFYYLRLGCPWKCKNEQGSFDISTTLSNEKTESYETKNEKNENEYLIKNNETSESNLSAPEYD